MADDDASLACQPCGGSVPQAAPAAARPAPEPELSPEPEELGVVDEVAALAVRGEPLKERHAVPPGGWGGKGGTPPPPMWPRGAWRGAQHTRSGAVHWQARVCCSRRARTGRCG